MPLYAPFNNAIFGETFYGIPPTPTISTTFSIVPLGYDGLQVGWTLPTGQWNEMVLQRSSFGTPLSVFSSDGVTLLDVNSPAQGFPVQYVDVGLRPGRFYYYSLFVFSTQLDEWVLAGAAQGLVITDWNFRGTYFSWTPDWYLEQDELFTATQFSNSGPLVRYLNLLGYEMDWIRSEIESFFLFTDIELISGALLPFLGANYGMQYEPELGMTRSRVLVKNAVHLYKNRGTQIGIEAAASAFTGYGCEVTIGPNLEIQLDDGAFDRSTGHWVPGNPGTTLSFVNPLTYGNIVPQHALYEPLPSIIASEIDTNGYLPINNENVALLSATSASSWAQLLPSIQPPTARQFGMMVYDPTSGTLILFGGQDPNGNFLNDTWSWNGVWTQLSPATSPPARAGSLFVWDPKGGVNNAVLFGGNSRGGPLNDTWVFNGSITSPNWIQKNPVNVPPGRYEPSGTYDTALTNVIMFGGQTQSGTPLNDTWSWDGTNWTLFSAGPAKIPSPPARDTPAVTYNSDTGQMILFGGALGATSNNCLNDTWVWNGTWSQVNTAHAPSPRAGAMMCYDPVRHLTYLFGGSPDNLSDTTFNDTWSFNGTDWTQLNPATKPPVRFEGAMVFFGTSGGGTSYLIGGNQVGSTELNDVWSFNGTNWSSITTTGTKPSAREDHALCYDPVHNVLWLFGGFDGNTTVNNETWALSATNAWTHVTPATSPSARCETIISYDAASNQFIMFGGSNHQLGYNAAETWLWAPTSGTAGNWTKLTPATSPSARAEYAMAYDSATGFVTLFGGRNSNTDFNDTWLWNGTTWSQPIILPSPRFAAPMAYDPTTAKVWLFGGNSINGILNDLWSWNGTAWAPVTPSVLPSARYGGPMVYDTSTARIVLFGGIRSDGTLLNDTWNFQASTTTWAVQSPATSPSARYGDAYAYNAANSEVMLFGGLTGGGVTSDTWGWNGTTWAQLSSTLYPVPRGLASMAYDANNNTEVLFGGGIAGTLYNDTWKFNGTSWTQISTGISTPQARVGATLTYDPQGTPDSVLFGGLGTFLNFINETWSWSGTAWTLLSPAASPTARWAHGACYDPSIGSGVVLVFGGQSGSGALNDTWDWNGTTWAQITTAHSPPVRFKHSMVYDTTTGMAVVFGGTNHVGPANQYPLGALSDTWIFNGTDWSQVVSVVTPPARFDATMVFDAVTGTVVLFGGTDHNGNPLSDTWSFDGANWSKLPPLSSPLPRMQSQAVYNTTSRTIVLFGGLNATSYLGDTWSWNFGAFPIQVTTGTSANATTLGIPIPQTATPPLVVTSAYFYPVPQATPVMQSFIVQHDWYGANGALIGSTSGAPVTEQPGTWVRATVTDSPLAGALTLHRTVRTASVTAGDLHLMDAVQTEINSQATPGPTAWDPPRDIKINLLPVRQNLVTNPQALAGTSPFTLTGTTNPLQSSATMLTPPVVTWPVDTMGGFVLTASGVTSMVQSATFPITGGLIYSFSAYVMPHTTKRTVTFTLVYKSALGTPLSTTSQSFTELTGQFARGSVIDVQAPANAAQATISLTVVSPVANEIHYTSAFLLEPLAYLLPYFDANFNPFTDYAWEGTPNQSVSDYYPNVQSKLSRLITVMPDYIPIGSTFSLLIAEQAAANTGPG